jgi:hypothetical protein
MTAHDLPEIHRREEIAVHDEHSVCGHLDLGQRAGSAERLVLPPVSELDAELRPIPEERFDQLCEMADGEMGADLSAPPCALRSLPAR